MNRRELLERLGAGGALVGLGQSGFGPMPVSVSPPNVERLTLATSRAGGRRLADVAPELERVLRRSAILTPPRYGVSDILP